jgi:hypothetical protein
LIYKTLSAASEVVMANLLPTPREYSHLPQLLVQKVPGFAASYHVLEWFATSHDLEVINVIVVEIFENLDCDPPVLEAIKTRLGPVSRQLYDKWLG